MYERRQYPPLPRRRFYHRMLSHVGCAAAIVLFSLGLGMVGYKQFEHLSWLDAFLNSAMLLGGMGPVNNPVRVEGKLFAAFYALYAGLVFLAVAGLLLAPVVHRVMHKFHWEGE